VGIPAQCSLLHSRYIKKYNREYTYPITGSHCANSFIDHSVFLPTRTLSWESESVGHGKIWSAWI